MSIGIPARLQAVAALKPVFEQKASLNTSLPAAQAKLNTSDAALTQALAFGVCRFYSRLNFWASQLMRQPFKKKDLDLHLLLLIGLYQLQEERNADYAVINTCVEASKKLNKAWASKLLNACLRNFQRRQTELTELAEKNSAAQTAHPEWLLGFLQQDYPALWPEICAANNVQGPMTLRINQRLTTRDAYLAELEQAGISAEASTLSPWALQLAQPQHPANLPGFAEGKFSVQDAAAQLAAHLLDVQNGMQVLDACAAPGGKTAHLAELADLKLIALDVDAQRLVRVRENLERLNLTAQVICADAATPETWWQEANQQQQFDRILLDAPCSATGVIRRHPDIKLLRRQEDISQLAELQEQILTALWPLLAKGGKLLYATCSVLQQENQLPLANFFSKHSDAQQIKLEADWGLEQTYGRQLLPQPNGNDGFFYCLLTKI